MSKIISLHSFRGGTGKSNITSNLAYLLFKQGKKVGIIDSDIESPGIHILFGIDQSKIKHTLNDYIWNQCSIKDAALNVSKNLDPDGSGKLFIVPSSLSAVDITKVLREGYNIDRLMEGYQKIIQELQLDYLLIDTHPGINEETLLSISLSDTLFVIMRPDQQDYQGTAITTALATKLDVPSLSIIVNKVMPSMDSKNIEAEVKKAYEIPVATMLPFSEKIISFGSSGLFAKDYPNEEISQKLQKLAHEIIAK